MKKIVKKGVFGMREVRIGLVGAGWMGKAHTSAFMNALMMFGSEYGKPVFLK
ncbi:hypothetical protein GCM10020331_097100 [Ectobacillus funiculus]